MEFTIEGLGHTLNLTRTKRDSPRPYGIVYCALHKESGKRYVGITTNTLRFRITQHKGSKFLFGMALRKYGEDAFYISIIDFAHNADELCAKEKHWISTFNCIAPNVYNLTTGGDHAYELPPEVGRKISQSKLGKARPDLKPEDLTGKIFSRLTVLSLVSMKPAKWLCECECGNTHTVDAAALKSDHIRSCGCLRSEATRLRKSKYGDQGVKGEPAYVAWVKYRSNMPEEWKDSFEQFRSDIGTRPAESVLCRRDRSKNFCKENCFWGNRTDHSRSYCAVMLAANGKVQSVGDWRKELGIHCRVMLRRHKFATFQAFVEQLS